MEPDPEKEKVKRVASVCLSIYLSTVCVCVCVGLGLSTRMASISSCCQWIDSLSFSRDPTGSVILKSPFCSSAGRVGYIVSVVQEKGERHGRFEWKKGSQEWLARLGFGYCRATHHLQTKPDLLSHLPRFELAQWHFFWNFHSDPIQRTLSIQ